MTPKTERPFPELEKGDLVDMGGWTVLNEARGLFEAGAVKENNWEAPLLSGTIQVGGIRYFPRLNLRSVTFAENRCNCQTGKRGMICEHAVALCIDRMEKVEEQEKVENEIEDVVETPTEMQSLVISEGKGLPLCFNLYLPPNLPTVALRDAIMVKLEAVVNNEKLPPEKLDRGRAYWLEPEHYEVAALVENLCGGRLHGLLQLRRDQLLALLKPLDGKPVCFWINKPQTPIPWEEDILSGVHEYLVLPEEEEKTEPPVEKAKPAPVHKPKASEFSPAVIDGSTQFLAISLPSRESPQYHDILDLLKNNGFKLEPSNRKWWLRDRHKTLNFLANNLEALRNDYHTRFTDNFKERTTDLHFAEITAEAKESGDGFTMEAQLKAGHTDEEELRQAIEKGQAYVSDGKETYLIEPAKLERFAQIQRALSGDVRRTLSTRYRQQLDVSALRDAEELLEPLTETFVAPETWKKRSAALKSVAHLQAPPLKEELDERLRSYQRIGVAWMYHLHSNRLGGVLADEMGLGKTIQALGLLSSLHDTGRTCTCLVVCPASLLENWRREASRFTPWFKVFVHHGNNRLETASAFENYDLVVTSYGTLTRDMELFQTVPFECIIADEAQHIRNRRTQSARALRSLQAEGRFVLTGTPVENSLDDLRSLMDFALPGYLAKIPAQVGRDERAWYDERHRQQAVPYILRRSKSLVAPELPEKIEQVVYCSMENAQRRLYEDFTRKAREEIFQMEMSGSGEGKLRMTALTHLLRMRQICADPRLVKQEAKEKDSAKLNAFLEILDEALDDGHRILVFSQFVSVLQLLSAALKEREHNYCYLDGHTRNRQEVCDRFNNDPGIPVFLISLKAGGTGLNLTGADTVVHFDPWWNPAVEAQATDRAHRIGQARVVTSIKLIAAESVEERVIELQQTKAALLRDLLDESAAATAKVSLQEIKDLLEPGS